MINQMKTQFLDPDLSILKRDNSKLFYEELENQPHKIIKYKNI